MDDATTATDQVNYVDRSTIGLEDVGLLEESIGFEG
jgi:hypothetical protein